MHAFLAILLIAWHWLHQSGTAPYILIGMGLPLGAGGALTGATMQGLATWDGGFWSTLAVAGNVVLTAAQMVAGSTTYLTITGAAGAINATTPSAAQLIAQYTSAYGVPPTIGSTWGFEMSNQNNGVVTLVAGAGVTINGTATVANAANRTWLCTVTNPNQAAVTLQNVGSRSN